MQHKCHIFRNLFSIAKLLKPKDPKTSLQIVKLFDSTISPFLVLIMPNQLMCIGVFLWYCTCSTSCLIKLLVASIQTIEVRYIHNQSYLSPCFGITKPKIYVQHNKTTNERSTLGRERKMSFIKAKSNHYISLIKVTK